MTTIVLWPLLAAPLIIGLALLLALGFRRNRAVMVLAVLFCAALGLSGAVGLAHSERSIEAVRMFAPWLLLAAAAMPERRLLARRNLALLAMLAVTVWLTLSAPAHIWPGLRDAFPLGWLPWQGGTTASGMVLIAAVVCLSRWIARRMPMELALFVLLLVVGIALLPRMRDGSASSLLALAGAIAAFSILYVSYRMAFVDGLAGLPNRRALDETLARLSGDFALAMVDIDHFKTFNDRHGHAVGDRTLQAVAAELASTRGADAFRYGGEEFCLLFTGSRVSDAKPICESLRERVARMRIAVRASNSGSRTRKAPPRDSAGVKVTVSIGLAQRGGRLRTTGDVQKAADKALYKAKSQGRNRVVVA